MNKKILFALLVLLLASLQIRPRKVDDMAIQFDGSTVGQRVTWTSSAMDISQISILTWANFDTLPAAVRDLWAAWTGSQFKYYMYFAPDSKFYFGTRFSTHNGEWGIGGFSTGQPTLLSVTYDASSPTNDPLMYRDATLVSETETQTPAGTVLTGANVIRLGGF
ncbi:MAG: hypothetical protein AB1649_01490, partial [Chloroflexota bacterium]